MTSSARTFEEQWKLFKLAYPDETFLKVERTVAEVFWNSRDEEFAELKAQLTETLAAKVNQARLEEAEWIRDHTGASSGYHSRYLDLHIEKLRAAVGDSDPRE